MESLEKVVEASEDALDDPAHRVSHGKTPVRGPPTKDPFDGQGLDAELVEEAVVTAGHARGLLQSHAQHCVQRPTDRRELVRLHLKTISQPSFLCFPFSSSWSFQPHLSLQTGFLRLELLSQVDSFPTEAYPTRVRPKRDEG